MKKTMILLIYLFAFDFLITTEAQTTTFDIVLKTKGNESGGRGYEINDGYLYLGSKQDTENTNVLFNMQLLKINPDGGFLSKTYCSQDTSAGIGYLKIVKPNLLGIGRYEFNTFDRAGGLYNVLFDSNLNILSKKIFPFPEPYVAIRSSAKKALTTPSGTYLNIVCLTESYNNQGYDAGDIFFYEFDGTGDTVRTASFKMEKGQQLLDVCFNGDSTQIWLFGTGFQAGVTQWVKFDMDYHLLSISEFYQKARNPYYIKQKNDNRWIGCGSYSVHEKGQNDDLWVFRMDSTGTILNETTIGTPDTLDYASFGRSVGFSKNGDIYISGTHNITLGFYPNVPSWIILTKLDSNFNRVFTKYYNPDGKYYYNIDLLTCKDNGIILSNMRYDSENNEDPPYNLDAWLTKVDANGYMTGEKENKQIEVKNALLYPNPGSNLLQVDCGWPQAELTLLNMNAIKVLTKHLKSCHSTINTTFLSSGEYIWIIRSNNKVIETGKWIKN